MKVYFRLGKLEPVIKLKPVLVFSETELHLSGQSGWSILNIRSKNSLDFTICADLNRSENERVTSSKVFLNERRNMKHSGSPLAKRDLKRDLQISAVDYF